MITPAMNPFTKALTARLSEQRLRAFVAQWDALEALVIRVYRVKQALDADKQEHARLRLWLAEHYPEWRTQLEPYWRRARCGSSPCNDDPFEFLLKPVTPEVFVGSWAHMQALPAAREALNTFILDIAKP